MTYLRPDVTSVNGIFFGLQRVQRPRVRVRVQEGQPEGQREGQPEGQPEGDTHNRIEFTYLGNNTSINPYLTDGNNGPFGGTLSADKRRIDLDSFGADHFNPAVNRYLYR